MKNLSKNERYWVYYDCGNSAYSLIITTAIFPLYFSMFKDGNGMDIGYFNSLASLLVAILSPILGTIADYKGKKKKFFTFFFLMGAVFSGALAAVPKGQWITLMAFYVLTCVGFAGSNVFYDAFLVDVSSEERMDIVSSQGFAYGYIFSIIPFLISLAVINFLGMSNLGGYKFSFILTAVWWIVFTLPMIKNIRQLNYIDPEPNPVINSFKRIYRTLKNIKSQKVVFVFLLAYFLYIDGVDTIIKMVVPYSQEVLGGRETSMYVLLGILVMVQVVAFPFAILYGKLAEKFGAKRMIIAGIITYIITVVFAYFVSSIVHMFVLGFMVASAQGGIQSLSRSYFAKIIPKENANEFFGFYNIFGKFAAIFGPLIMSVIKDLTGIARYSILGLVPLFVAGLAITLSLPDDRQKVIKA